MPDRGKVIKGLEAHEKGCGHRSHYCDVMECPYRYWDESCNIEEMCHDAIVLLKEQNEVIDALLKVGYPHNFQREEPWIVNYMYAITDVIKQAVHLRNGGD